MKNLAGIDDADAYIQEELLLAGIPLVKGEQSKSEVPYTYTGSLCGWHFRRLWCYWSAAQSVDGEGLPLDLAVAMHERRYPIVGDNQPKTYGQVVRAGGHAAGPHPNDMAYHYDAAGHSIIIDLKGDNERATVDFLQHADAVDPSIVALFRNMRFVKSLDRIEGLRSYVNLYHVDTQLGLNELARVIGSYHPADAEYDALSYGP